MHISSWAFIGNSHEFMTSIMVNNGTFKKFGESSSRFRHKAVAIAFHKGQFCPKTSLITQHAFYEKGKASRGTGEPPWLQTDNRIQIILPLLICSHRDKDWPGPWLDRRRLLYTRRDDDTSCIHNIREYSCARTPVSADRGFHLDLCAYQAQRYAR